MSDQTHRQMVDDAIQLAHPDCLETVGGRAAAKRIRKHAIGTETAHDKACQILALEVRRLRSEIEQLTIKQKDEHAED